MKKINRKELFNLKNKETRKLWFKTFEPLIWTILIFLCMVIGYYYIPHFAEKYNCSDEIAFINIFWRIFGMYSLMYYIDMLVKRYVNRNK